MILEINGKLNFGIRDINEGDLKDLENFVKFSKSKNWCGKACIAIRFLFTGKGIISTQNVTQLIEKSPSKKEIYEKYPFFQTLLKANKVALNHFPEQPLESPQHLDREKVKEIATPKVQNPIQIPVNLDDPYYNRVCLSLDDLDINPDAKDDALRFWLCEYFTNSQEDFQAISNNIIKVSEEKSEPIKKLVLEEVAKARNYNLRKKEKEARIQKIYPNGIHENPGKHLDVDFSKLNINLEEIKVGLDKDGNPFQCSVGQVIVMLIKEIHDRLDFLTNFYKEKGKHMAYTIEEFRNIPNLLSKDIANLSSIPYENNLPLDQTPFRNHVQYSKSNIYATKPLHKNFLDKVLEVLFEANYIMDFEFSPCGTALRVQV